MTSTALPTVRRPARLPLLAHEIRFNFKVFARSPLAALVTLGFPLVFMVMFNQLRGGEVVSAAQIPFVQYSVPGVIVFVVTGSCYLTMATGIVSAREKGVLKRLRSTPLPAWLHLAGRIGVTSLVSVAGVALMLAIGFAAFGLQMEMARTGTFVVAFLLGTAVFCILGVAVTPLMPTVESSQAIATATLYPMLFLSGVFFPVEGAPALFHTIIDILPGRPFVVLMQDAFITQVPATGLWSREAFTLLIWGIVGAALALRTMRWEPNDG